MTYYSERTQSKTSPEQQTEEVQRKPGTSFREPSPGGVTQDALIPPGANCDNTCDVLPSSQDDWRLSAQGFCREEGGGPATQSSLPAPYHDSRLAGGRQVFSMKHTDFEPLLSGIGGDPPKPKFPDASPGPALPAGL